MLDSLRQDKDALDALDEKLFLLWGDLREKKLQLQMSKSLQSSKTNADTDDTPMRLPKRSIFGDEPPSDSDEENNSKSCTKSNTKSTALAERDPNIPLQKKTDSKDSADTGLKVQVQNRAFTCCIQEYGVKVPTEVESNWNAGAGMEWKRAFKMFGTMIC